MCLAVPGRILSIQEGSDPLARTGRVSFGGAVKEACLAYVPEAKVGDYVIVHVGFALSVLDEEEAARTLEYFRQLGEIAAKEEKPSDNGIGPHDYSPPRGGGE
ncbi:MAG: HypC/HybG/HupF family hydrogenase formation chaperone [Elusimicrobiota bacterium]|jgi:hydrogenase expression/formation protein HypC